jgi:hypothetical protein
MPSGFWHISQLMVPKMNSKIPLPSPPNSPSWEQRNCSQRVNLQKKVGTLYVGWKKINQSERGKWHWLIKPQTPTPIVDLIRLERVEKSFSPYSFNKYLL